MKKIALIGIPFDENSSYMRGTALAPPLIRDAFYSDASNSYTESGIDLSKEGLINDRGDITVPHFQRIQASIADALDGSFVPISLGGDHSVTYPILRAFRPFYPEIAILHFDAHPDLYHDF